MPLPYAHLRRIFPPRLRCPHCGDTATEWVAASGRGTLYSYVVVHQRLHPAFDASLPYAVGLVQLAEGPRMLAMLIERLICRLGSVGPTRVPC